MNDKKYLLLIDNDAKAVMLPFPGKLNYPLAKTVHDRNGKPIVYQRTDRYKTNADGLVANIYVLQNSHLNLDDIADPKIEEKQPETSDIPFQVSASDFKPASEPFNNEQAAARAVIVYLEKQLANRKLEYELNYEPDL